MCTVLGAKLAALRDVLRHYRSLPAEPIDTPYLDRIFGDMLEMTLVAALFRGNFCNYSCRPGSIQRCRNCLHP